MSTEQPSIPGISSRRSACDKCRFSKARCLRSHPEQPKCDRCTRTQCECTTSPIFRVRDWKPGGGSDFVSRRRGSKSEYSNRRRRDSERQSISSETGITSSKDLPSGNGRKNLSASRTASFLGFDRYSQPTLTAPPGISYEDTETYAERVIGDRAGIMESTLTDFSLQDEFSATIPILEWETNSTPSLPFISPPIVNPGDRVVSSFSRNNPLGDLNPQDHGVDNSEPFLRTERTQIQRLSQLDYELIALRVKLEQEVREVVMQTLFEGNGNDNLPYPSVLNDILGKTADFVDILSCLSRRCASEIELSSQGSTNGTDHSRRRSSSLSSCSDYDSDATASTPQASNTPQLTISSASGQSHAELDTPAFLLILASYSRLLGIYLIVFSHIYEYLRTISESDNPHLRRVSGLSIGNYSAHSGNLQMLILIQIVTSYFEKIEVLLGLPIELRISRRRGEREGLFGAYGFLDLATAILGREDGETLGSGKGGIKTLRRNISRAKALLKERIAP
ncbi:hypothetical protein HD806DRAFT_428962 [Xylariaceae sp. AK1471]|nr:hypothetical protein HD806DRAFT_428962 [Xylariaceae sp. AK1471]